MTEGSRIGTAAAIVAVGVLLSRVLGFGRDLTMAVVLGRTAETDLYQYAFTIPDFAFYLVAGGFLSITLIPILATRLEQGDGHGANRAFTAVFRTVAGVLGVVTLGAGLATGSLVDLVFPDVTGEAADRLVTMTRLALVLQVLFALGALFSAVEFAHRRFVVPTLGPIIYNAGIILGGIAGRVLGDPSPEAFLWGGLAGALTGSFLLQWWGARRVGLRFARSHGPDPAVREYLGLAIPLMIGQTVIALDEQWPRAFGQFGPDGTTAGLQYARRLMMLPVGVIAQAAGVAAYPFLAGLAARGDQEGLQATVVRTLRAGLVLAVPATFVVVVPSAVWVRVALQWGAFTAADTVVVAGLLAIYALAMPFWVIHQVVTRAFYARRRMWEPVVIGTAVTALTVPVLFLVRGDGSGIAWVSAGAVAVYSTAVAVRWFSVAGPRTRAQMMGFGGALAAAAAAGAAMAATAPWVGSVPATVGAVAAFAAVGHLLGIDEIPQLARRVLKPR